MQQIINHSIINYKAFFRWLFTAIMHLMDEPVPDEFSKMTQQDLAYISEFLQNFDNIGNSLKSGFIMERLGQYLSDADLTIEPAMETNEWSNFLAQNLCVQENANILPHYKNLSLIQQYKKLNEKIETIFRTLVINETMFEIHAVLSIFQQSLIKMTVLSISNNGFEEIFAFVSPTKQNVYLLKILPGKTQVGKIHFKCENTDNLLSIQDVKIYSPTVLSVLLYEASNLKSVFLSQVPLTPVLDELLEFGTNVNGVLFENNSIPDINGANLPLRVTKCIEGMETSEFAVSGSRKVAIVLSQNKKKARLYEMEGEEEEDEDADMNSTIRDAEMSHELGTDDSTP